jgi:hypothetical protein
MKITHFLLLAVALVWFDKRHVNAMNNQSPVDRVWNTEAATFGQMNGTNFTNSVWDAQSGQPGYMFGTVPAPGGTATMGNWDNTGVAMVGHF